MMGSANEGGMRTDYLNGILDKFNATLKKADEDAFKTEAKYMTDPVLEFSLDVPARSGWSSTATGPRVPRTQRRPPGVGVPGRTLPNHADAARSRGRRGGRPRTRRHLTDSPRPVRPVVTATHGRAPRTPSRAPPAPAAELLSDLIEHVREHPVAVVTFAAEAVDRWTCGWPSRVSVPSR